MEGSREKRQKDSESPIECGYCNNIAVTLIGGTSLCRKHKGVILIRRRVIGALEEVKE